MLFPNNRFTGISTQAKQQTFLILQHHATSHEKWASKDWKFISSAFDVAEVEHVCVINYSEETYASIRLQEAAFSSPTN